jgi:small subunit ribosomal protein S9
MADAKATPTTYYWGTGRRKTAVARVRITEGNGQITVNDRPLREYFTEERDRAAVIGPLELTDQVNRLNVFIRADGGGFSGQAGAACQGLARALKEMFGGSEPPAPPAAEAADGEAAPETAPGGMVKKLRDSGFLTRDSRMKERKKYGRKGARKSFQFSKR